jgi:ADP-heptose:LPS heptosyltransferase
MNVEVMRRLDSLLGVPACRLFAATKRLGAPRRAPRGEVKKIAVMKFFGMGSLVVASPTMLALRDEYPGAELHFVTFESNRALLEMLDVSDKNHFVDPSSPKEFVRTTLATARELRRERIDLVIDLEFYAKFPLVLGSLAGVPRKAGFQLTAEAWREDLLDVMGSYNHYFHTKDIFLSLVYLLARNDHYYVDFGAFADKYKYPKYTPSVFEVAALRGKLRAAGIKDDEPIFVINPNTSPDLAPEARKWPEERYAQLADAMLHDHPSGKVVLVGANSDRDYVTRVASHAVSKRVISLAGALDVRELVTLFSLSRVVVSNDSGPMHLACLVDAPTIGLFFADSPTLFAPLCTNAIAIAPPLYSIPLFTVYNGKDVAVGKPVSEITNVAACTVPLAEVVAATRQLLATVRTHKAAEARA